MESFANRFTDKLATSLRSLGLEACTDNQACIGYFYSLLRCSPEAIKCPYKERDFLMTGVTDQHKKLFTFSEINVRYSDEGRPEKDAAKAKNDYYYDPVTGRHTRTEPWITMKELLNKRILPVVHADTMEEVNKNLKKIMKTIAGCLIAEERAKDCIRYQGTARMGKTQIPVSKINPLVRDLWSVPLILSKSLKAAEKGPLALLAEIFAHQNDTDYNAKKYVEILTKTLKGKIGAEVVNVLLSYKAERGIKLGAQMMSICKINHSPPIHPDISTIARILSRKVTGRAAMNEWLFASSGNVAGFSFTDAAVASAYKLLCSTAEIYMPHAVEILGRLAQLSIEAGRQRTMAGYTRTTAAWVQPAFANGTGKGATCGYNPTGGGNMTKEEFERLYKIVEVALKNQGQTNPIMNSIARAREALEDCSVKFIDQTGAMKIVNLSWHEFFHTQKEGDPVKKQAPKRQAPSTSAPSASKQARQEPTEGAAQASGYTPTFLPLHLYQQQQSQLYNLQNIPLPQGRPGETMEEAS